MTSRPAPEPAVPCPRGFPEELISGYLDRALTQGDRQRVRLHLGECPDCRRTFDDLSALREVTLTTRFYVPEDDQWREDPRSPASRLLRSGGWVLLLVWLAAVGAFALWHLAIAPGNVLGKALVFTGLSGGGLLFLSILIDRLRALRTDRYRSIQK